MEGDMKEYLCELFTNRLASEGFFLVLNAAVENAVKLKKHHISNESPICRTCRHVDNNLHRLKALGVE
jgi:hypothetical protein